MGDASKTSTSVKDLGEIFKGSVPQLAVKMGVDLKTHAGVLQRDGDRVSIEFKARTEIPQSLGDITCIEELEDGSCVLWAQW